MINRQPVYPMFPASSWWPLRQQFKKKLPPLVDARWVASVLGVEERTARNLLPTLRHLELIDERGEPTERGERWRIDTIYPEVCRELREEIYPADLRDRFGEPGGDQQALVGWFMRQTGVGEAAAKRMARFYELLLEADPDVADGHLTRRASRSIAVRRHEAPPAPARDELDDQERGGDRSSRVELHLHFDPDLSPSQIEKIFESMASYLKR